MTKKLSKNLHTKVSIKHVDFGLFNKMLLEGTLILDKKNDTLLYAGSAKVNITDWFFFKDNIVLKYIALDDALINMNRKDSVWNYQFLADYFSSPGKKTDTSKNVVKLDLKIVEFNRIRIVEKDEWIGQDMLLSLNKLNLYTDDFDTHNHTIKINTLVLDQPVFSQTDYDGKRPENPHGPAKPADDVPSGLQWNSENWIYAIGNLEIKNGSFFVTKSSNPVSAQKLFDEDHIRFTSINGTVKNLQFIQDTLTAKIDLSANERSGLIVKKLIAGLRFTPDIMEFKGLDLTTNKSHFTDYYAMKYKSFNRDMGSFMHAVTLEANFVNSEISSDDLSFFAPETGRWARKFLISGQAHGTIDNLYGKNIIIRSGNNNYFNGDVSIRGLPYMSDMYIDLHSRDLKTSYAEMVNLVPQLKKITTPDLAAMGNIGFSGTFLGFINDFVTYGVLTTSIGTLKTDLNMKFPDKGSPVYSGHVVTDDFQLGRFIDNSQLGKISFNGKVSGTGFSEKTMNISVDGFIGKLQFNDYIYQRITAKGNLRKKIFEGEVSIDDPNLKVDGLVGSINFNLREPQFNFEAGVRKLNLKNLHLTNDDFSLTGTFNLNFSGNNIDNFLGSARIYDATLHTGDQKLSFDSLTISSFFFNDKKHLTVQTNELDASVTGNFKILELPDAFQLFLNRYYPAYIRKPFRNVHEQNFSFDIKTKNISDYISLITNKLKGFDNSRINGDIDLSKNTLFMQTTVPLFNYSNINFYNTSLTAKGTLDSLKLNNEIEDVVINDSLHFPNTKIVIGARNDLSDVSIKTAASRTLNEADLSVRVQTLSDGFKLYFNPSSFVINEKKWILEKGGELVLSKKILTASEVKFVQDKQELIISTEPSTTGNTNDVVVDFKNLNIGDIVPFVLKSPHIDGLLTGNVRISDPFKNLNAEFDSRIDQFYFENDSIGVLKLNGNYSGKSPGLFVNAISDNELYNFVAQLNYKPSDSTNRQLEGQIHLNHSNIHFLDKYLSGIFSGISGTASGDLNFSGSGKDPKITGRVSLNDASMTVDYTRCRYIVENNSVITFNTDEIDFGTLKIRDTLNNTATLSGKLYHTFFDNFYFNEMRLRTDSRNGNPSKFLLLNTTSKDNDQFYGNVIGSAELSLNGPVNDMKMVIRGEPTDSSHIYLPTSETAESGKITYIEFIKLGREMKNDFSSNQEANIKVDMELNANPFAKIDVILDEVTKDIIKAQGSGRLNITAGTKEPLTIRGRYDVQQGEYTFNFQTFLKTPFSLQSGYIEWQGDPYLANLNIDALYRATQVNLSSILTSTGFSNARGDVDIIFKLRGTLKDPRPDFEFQLPFDNPLKNDPIANEYLKTKFQADKNQLNKQVTALLLFNTFITEQQSLFSTNNTGNFVFRSVGQILSSTLSSSLNNWLQKLLKTDQVNLYTNINTSDFNFEKGITEKQIQNLGNFGFRTTFLKNRLLINFGGNVDYKLIQASNNSSSNFLFTPDVSFEYLITPDGKFRVVGFNRSDANTGDLVGVTRHNRTGVQLSYRKDFNTFTELFGGK
ncbi:MAG: translocation/assembly module TamB domain-containing protein [Ginsengibacter sp.]